NGLDGGTTLPGSDAAVDAVPTGPEVCDNGVDDDLNGSQDEGCPCAPGTEPRACYEGPAGTGGVGQCTMGTQTCTDSDEFGAWSECVGSVFPAEELCDDRIDNDCDGEVDEGCIPPHMPEQCSLATMMHVREIG